MKTEFPNIVVLSPQLEGADQPQAIAMISSILQAHPEITGAFGTTGNSAINWATALKQSGKQPGDITVIGMDYTRANLDAIKAGWVFAIVAQPLYDEAAQAVYGLVAHLKGQDVTYANYLPAPIVTIKDIDKYYSLDDRVDAASKGK
jgi:ribose transport system substrate-binding protein